VTALIHIHSTHVHAFHIIHVPIHVRMSSIGFHIHIIHVHAFHIIHVHAGMSSIRIHIHLIHVLHLIHVHPFHVFHLHIHTLHTHAHRTGKYYIFTIQPCLFSISHLCFYGTFSQIHSFHHHTLHSYHLDSHSMKQIRLGHRWRSMLFSSSKPYGSISCSILGSSSRFISAIFPHCNYKIISLR